MENLKQLSHISSEPPIRYSTGLSGLDRVFGGGIVRGATVLLAGVPGAGKSTLLLQVAGYLGNNLDKKILYIAGEENQEQIKMRAERMAIDSDNVWLIDTTEINEILALREQIQPDIIIIDSLQMLYDNKLKASPATPTQMKRGIMEISKMAKHTNTTVIFVGHATKGGYVAGLQTLQHMVDTVITLTRNEEDGTRLLKATKNRFGSTETDWPITMTATGLVETSVENQSDEINISAEKLEALLEDHPIWRPVVRASLGWLKDQTINQTITSNERG